MESLVICFNFREFDISNLFRCICYILFASKCEKERRDIGDKSLLDLALK